MGEGGKRTRGGPGRGAGGEQGGREHTAVESPSINFHARIIIGKLESWLPDSRFVSPNESERVGAQRRAATGDGGSFRLYAASSKSSMLRRAIIIVSLASFPLRGRPAGQQIHADLDRGTERAPCSGLPSPGRRGAAAGGRVFPFAPKPGPFANGRLRRRRGSLLRLPNSVLWPPARPPSHPRLTAVGTGVHSPPGPGRRIPKPCRGLWPAFCETHTGLRKRTLAV